MFIQFTIIFLNHYLFSCLCRDVISEDEGVFESVTLFAAHSIISVVGQDKVIKRTQTLAQYQRELEVEVDAANMIEGDVNDVEGSMHENNAVVEGKSVVMSGTEDSADNVNNNEDHTEGGEGEGEVEGEVGNGDGEGDVILEEEDLELKLSTAVESYDDGKSFEGIFTECKLFSGVLQPGVTDKTIFQVKKSVQLLSQLCLVKPSLLTILYGIYGTAAASHREIITDSNSTSDEVQEKSVKVTASTSVTATATATSNAAASTDVIATKGTINSKYSVICDVIESEISSITPAIAKHLDSLALFSMFISKESDPFMRPLLELCLQITHSDPSIPASLALIEAVKEYLKTPLFLRSVTGYDEYKKHEEELNNSTNKDDVKIASATSTSTSISISLFESNKSVATLKLYFPLLGGLSAAELIGLLPRLLNSFCDEPDVLKDAFKKIYSARPPPLSRAALFAALHRWVVQDVCAWVCVRVGIL